MEQCGISHVRCVKPGRDAVRQKHQYFRQNSKTGEMSRLKNGELFLILIPRSPVKLQKDFQKKVTKLCWHQRSSSSTREGCVSLVQGFLLLPLWALGSVRLSPVCHWGLTPSPDREKPTLHSQTYAVVIAMLRMQQMPDKTWNTAPTQAAMLRPAGPGSPAGSADAARNCRQLRIAAAEPADSNAPC